MTPTRLKILCVGRKKSALRGLTQILEVAGYEVQTAPRKLDGSALTAVTAELSDTARAERRVQAKAGRAASMTLRALRATVGKTQGEVARKTAMSQPQLSRVEARQDHLISTLRRYVRALGGEIEVNAIVKGVRITLRQV